MKVADWIGVGVLVAGVAVGGFFFVKKGQMFNGNVVPAGGPSQATPPAGAALPATPKTSTASEDHTLADIAAGVGLAKQGIAMAKDLFEAFESFGD